MSRSRKIFLYVIAVIFAGLEVLNGVAAYLDRNSSFFKGLAPLLCEILLIPIVLGILWGIFEASADIGAPTSPTYSYYKQAFRKLGASSLRALAILIAHACISPIVSAFGLDELDSYFSSFKIVLLWSCLLGFSIFILGYFLTKLTKAAMHEIKRAHEMIKAKKEADLNE